MCPTVALATNPGTRGSMCLPLLIGRLEATAFTNVLDHWHPYVIPNNQTHKLDLDCACVLCLHCATFRDLQAKQFSPQGCILRS